MVRSNDGTIEVSGKYQDILIDIALILTSMVKSAPTGSDISTDKVIKDITETVETIKRNASDVQVKDTMVNKVNKALDKARAKGLHKKEDYIFLDPGCTVEPKAENAFGMKDFVVDPRNRDALGGF